jgi:2-furoyl-CoA dehydrogenase large subunit
VYFALERLMQRIAVELGLDPLELYRRNFVPADAFPYRAAAGALLDSGNYEAVLVKALEDGGIPELQARRARARAEGRLYGLGFAAIVEPSVSNMGYVTTALTAADRARAGAKNGAIASATVSVDPLGSVSVLVDSTPQGQGHATVAAQVVADALGLAPSDIAVNAELDTQKDAWSIASGNYSSRFAAASAGAVHLAATNVRKRLAEIAAPLLETEPGDVMFAGGKIFARSRPERTLAFSRVAGGTHWAPALLPSGAPPGLRETVFWSPVQLAAPDENDVINTSATYGFAFDCCALEIDRETGRIRLDRYITAHDAGRLLNPALADGQIRGGFAQGLGAALMEELAYNADGSFLSGTYADYLMPTAGDVPEPSILHVESPSPFTPLGAKGLGEGNNMTTPVCVANAVADALGVADVTLPLTPSRIWSLLGVTDPPPSKQFAVPMGDVAGGHGLTGAGSVEIAASPETVFAVLLDPNALANVIPGCRELQPIGEHRYRADVTVGVGLIKARYDAEIELSDLHAPRALRLRAKGIGGLGAAEGSGRIRLEPSPLGTRLEYEYDAAVSGTVAAVGGRMLEQGATLVLKQLFEQLGRQASSQAAEPRRSWWRRMLGARAER